MVEYSLEELNKQKEKHSKMQKLQYSELKMQNYLKSKETTKSQKINILKFRTHMATFK